MSLSSKARELLAVSMLASACNGDPSKDQGTDTLNDSDTPVGDTTDSVDTNVDTNETVDTTEDTDLQEPGRVETLQTLGLSLVRAALPAGLIPRDASAAPGEDVLAGGRWNEPWVVLSGNRILAPGFVDPVHCPDDQMPILDAATFETVACLDEKVAPRGVTYVAAGESHLGGSYVILSGLNERATAGVFKKGVDGNYIETSILPAGEDENNPQFYRGAFFLPGLPNGADGLTLRVASLDHRDPNVDLCTFSIDASGQVSIQDPCITTSMRVSEVPYTFRTLDAIDDGKATLVILRGDADTLTAVPEFVNLVVTGDTLSASQEFPFPLDAPVFQDLPAGKPIQLANAAPMGFTRFWNNVGGAEHIFYKGAFPVWEAAVLAGPQLVIGTTQSADPAFYAPNYPSMDGLEDQSYGLSINGALMSERFHTLDGGAYVRQWDNIALPTLIMDENGQVQAPHLLLKTGGDDGSTAENATLDPRDMGVSVYTQAWRDGLYENTDYIPVNQPNHPPYFNEDVVRAGQFYSQSGLGVPTEGFTNDLSITNARTFTSTRNGDLLIGTAVNIPLPGREAVPVRLQWQQDSDRCEVYTLHMDTMTDMVNINVTTPTGDPYSFTVMPNYGGLQVHHGAYGETMFVACDGIQLGVNPELDIREAIYAQ